MTIGTKWLRQAEAAAATRAARMIEAAQRELIALLPDASVELGAGDLRIVARHLLRRWISDPALRFLLWKSK